MIWEVSFLSLIEVKTKQIFSFFASAIPASNDKKYLTTNEQDKA